ncbi:MAG: OmpA family protein [Butyrivibrio sp.]|nr:OmpA family protein [Butyrivibrio sp.]
MLQSRRKRRSEDEEVTYWLSYSDMMAGLLLVFVLIISVTMLRARVQYDAKELELLGKEQDLLVQTDALEEERATVASQRLLLDEQQNALLKQEDQLRIQAAELIAQQDRLATQEEELARKNLLLSELQDLYASQQAKLDQIIGVRAALVEALRAEFDDSDLQIAVDEQTGAITFRSSVLFAYGDSDLKPSGEEFLSEFLPRYVRILLSPRYRDYISEIIIEGNADTDGSYLYNLELSQKRAYSVAAYCLADESNLSKAELEAFRKVVTTGGRSFSNPVLDENGEIDMDASRRVEFLFRLTDEEMIREMINILSEQE